MWTLPLPVLWREQISIWEDETMGTVGVKEKTLKRIILRDLSVRPCRDDNKDAWLLCMTVELPGGKMKTVQQVYPVGANLGAFAASLRVMADEWERMVVSEARGVSGRD